MADDLNSEKQNSIIGAERDFCDVDKTPIRIVPQDETHGKDLAPLVVPDILPIETGKGIIGSTVAGIAIKSMIGSGGMSCVYRGIQSGINREVAVKMMHPHLLSDDTAMMRFHQEAQAVGKLDHPNIVKVHDFRAGENGNSFLVMDLVMGKSLDQIIDDEHQLTPERTIEIFSQACDGLEHAHAQGIVHRDLKPSNIMVVQTPTGEERVKVLDFGIAKILPQEGDKQMKLTQTGEVFGSPLYMSPEQCMGKPVDRRTDIYAMGCLIYESITGKPPFEGANAFDTFFKHTTEMPASVRSIREDFAMWREFDAIILKAMAKDPKDRYQSMTQLKIDLLKLQEQTDRGWIGKAADDAELARRRFGAQGKRSVKSIVVQVGLVALLAGTAGGAWFYFSNVIETQNQTWDKLYLAGQQSFNHGDYKKATQQFETALKLADKDKTKMTPVLRELVDVQIAQGILDEQKYISKKATIEKELNDSILAELADLMTEFNKTATSSDPDAKERLESLAQEINDKTNLLTAPSAEARERLESALKTVITTYDKLDVSEQKLGYARALHNYAESLGFHKNYKEAIPLYEKSMKIKAAINSQDPALMTSYLQTISSLAKAYNNAGDQKTAEKVFQKRIAEARKMPSDNNKHSVASNPKVANGKLALAQYYYYSQHDAKAARLNANEALRIYEQSENPSPEDQAECCALLGMIDLETGNLASAEEFFLRSQQLFEPMHRHGSLAWIETLNGLAQCAFAKKDYQTAEPMFRRCLAVGIENSPHYSSYVEVAMKKLDEISQMRGASKIDDLKALQQMRLQIDIAQQGTTSPAVMNDYLSLFELARGHKDMASARKYLNQAASILEKNKDESSWTAAKVLFKQAVFEFDSAKKAEGELLFQRLVSMVEGLTPTLNENKQLLKEIRSQLVIRMPGEVELAQRVKKLSP